jgi:prepilin-type processing-associated H-X9-DG protein
MVATRSMVKDQRFVPTGVKAPHSARVMTITWADGHVSALPHDILRAYCPCAHCQGHGGTIKRVEPPPGATEAYLEVREIERVGNYALSFTWGDSHATGIYTFKYLRSLCQCDACKPNFSVGVEDPHGEG